MQSIVIGKITKPKGIKGEVKVVPLTDNPERFKLLTEVQLDGERFKSAVLEIERCSLSAKAVILKLRGIETRNQAEELKGCYITIQEEQTVPLKEGNYFIHQIVGLTAVDENGEMLGKVIDIRPNPGNDIFVIEKDSKEFLIPAVKEIVTDIDLDKGRIVINNIEGLLD